MPRDQCLTMPRGKGATRSGGGGKQASLDLGTDILFTSVPDITGAHCVLVRLAC